MARQGLGALALLLLLIPRCRAGEAADCGETLVRLWWDSGGTLVRLWWDSGGTLDAMAAAPSSPRTSMSIIISAAGTVTGSVPLPYTACASAAYALHYHASCSLCVSNLARCSLSVRASLQRTAAELQEGRELPSLSRASAAISAMDSFPGVATLQEALFVWLAEPAWL